MRIFDWFFGFVEGCLYLAAGFYLAWMLSGDPVMVFQW